MKKKKKKKVNVQKLITRVIVLIILIVCIISLKNLIFSDKNNETYEFSLIVDKEDITSNLKSNIYINQTGTVYMDIEDVKNIFDDTIFYEETSNKVITTSGTKVAAIGVDNNLVELNGATITIDAEIKKYDGVYFIPISELTNIYNIEVKVRDTKAIILSLYKSLSTMNTLKDVSLKKEPGALKKTIQKLEKDKEVIYIEETEDKKWVKVLTDDGNIGYINKKNLSDIKEVRMDMQETDFTYNVPNIDSSIEVNKSVLTEEALIDFTSRKAVIENIIKDAISKEKYTINLNLEEVTVSKKNMERFIIEIGPRLKEFGGSIIVTNNNILDNEFLNKNNLNL